ncbi:PVC-type heme-binding CxxCH protein [Saccharobesus litoralis]|nr:PVC-type heme-binding CxxCH protein [Saccharobesus litoralis]
MNNKVNIGCFRSTLMLNMVALLGCLLTSGVAYAEFDKDKLQSRLNSLSLPTGLKASLWTESQLTENPAYFSFDSQGRMLLTELARPMKGTDDIRHYSLAMAIDDVSIETLDDRLAMYQRYADKIPMSHYTQATDQIRLLQDTNNDGIADKSHIYATGFNDVLDGLGAGVIERDGDVYYTNIPHLWKLTDKDQDGIADERESLQSGFGTRVSFMGHDMHGLAWGPDGRLYWSLGDRGYSFTTKEGKKYHAPNYGAVFRSNPDGSNLEVFYTGLRNPQELVFDEFGNLFTADNDGDHGDIERVNFLIEGGDSGWHAGHQSIMSFTRKFGLRASKYVGQTMGPVAWLALDMSRPRNDNQPAFMLPSIGALYTGPSGFAYNPSNYLGEEWRNSFFIAHFVGSIGGGYITTFKLEPNGASFLMKDRKEMLRGINLVDVDFGPDGRFYLSEFNWGGWQPENEGAIHVIEPQQLSSEQRTKQNRYQTLLTQDYADKSFKQLIALLNEDHQHIRQRAQFAMAKRGHLAQPYFQDLALDTNQPLFTRIHAIWGLSQLVWQHNMVKQDLGVLLPLLNDQQEQVRIQVARVLGDHRADFAFDGLRNALDDTHNRVAMYAAIGLGWIGDQRAVANVIDKLLDVEEEDLWLRHALVMALAGIDKQHWLAFKNHDSQHVRMAVLLALRQTKAPELVGFLQDKNQRIVNEAIYAIDDLQITPLRSQMAALLTPTKPTNSKSDVFAHHRLINANYNEGKIANAKRLLAYAATKELPENLAADALGAIEGWQDVNPIDHVVGFKSQANSLRPDITALVHEYLADILANTTGKAQVQAMRMAGHFNYDIAPNLLMAIAEDPLANEDIRVQALTLLSQSLPQQAVGLAKTVLPETKLNLQSTAIKVLLEHDTENGIQQALALIASGKQTSQKAALTQLHGIKHSSVTNMLLKLLAKLNDDVLPTGIALEVIETAQASTDPQVLSELQRYHTKLSQLPIEQQYASTLEGGIAQQGRDIFFSGSGQCSRCHRVNWQGGKMGPDLSSVGLAHNEQYLLRALVDPSADTAVGFGSITLEKHNGDVISGVYWGEDSDSIKVKVGHEDTKTHLKSTLKNIQRPISGMPPMNYMLTKRQLRDVMAFLKTLKRPVKKKAKGH